MADYPFSTPHAIPSGTAGGDLSGTYPNPVVSQIDGETLGSTALLATLGALALQAATPAAGYTLVNGTGNIITWTAPNDGNLHWVLLIAELSVTTIQVGGNISVNAQTPDGTSGTFQIYPGSQGVGAQNMSFCVYVLRAGATFTVEQNGAQTSGAAKFWAGVWGL